MEAKVKPTEKTLSNVIRVVIEVFDMFYISVVNRLTIEHEEQKKRTNQKIDAVDILLCNDTVKHALLQALESDQKANLYVISIFEESEVGTISKQSNDPGTKSDETTKVDIEDENKA